jgi:hypothetical protein
MLNGSLGVDTVLEGDRPQGGMTEEGTVAAVEGNLGEDRPMGGTVLEEGMPKVGTDPEEGMKVGPVGGTLVRPSNLVVAEVGSPVLLGSQQGVGIGRAWDMRVRPGGRAVVGSQLGGILQVGKREGAAFGGTEAAVGK